MNPYLKFLISTPENATNNAIQAGADPQDLARAKAELGQQEYIGYCQAFVEQATGSGFQGESASAAWQNQQNKAVVDPTLSGIQPGDEVYFNDPNNPEGHVGIADKNNQFVSATNNGVQENNINDWMQMTGQQPLGYIPQTTNPYMKFLKGGSYGTN